MLNLRETKIHFWSFCVDSGSFEIMLGHMWSFQGQERSFYVIFSHDRDCFAKPPCTSSLVQSSLVRTTEHAPMLLIFQTTRVIVNRNTRVSTVKSGFHAPGTTTLIQPGLRAKTQEPVSTV